MKNILVLCTGNSYRSQIMEGYLRCFLHEKANVYSAGIETHGVNPRAVLTMQADNIDISTHTSNHVLEYEHVGFDYVITVCDHAQEKCPYFPTNALKIHQNFPDPAKATGTENEIMAVFASVRQTIKDFAQKFANDFF